MKALDWLLVFFFLVLLLWGLCLLSRYKGIKKLSYRRYFSQDGVFEGETVYLVEEICNTFFLPLFFVDVEAYIYGSLVLDTDEHPDNSAMQSFCSRFFLMPFTRVQRKHPVQCVKRGYYQLESVHIYFMKNSIHLPAPTEIYVYPRLLPMEETASFNREIQNNCLTFHNLIHDPFSLAGLRDYRHGDPFRSINFKATAKTGTLKVNEQDPLSNRNFMIYINYQNEAKNVYISAGEYEKKMEQALSLAGFLTQQAVENGYKTGFSANADTADGDRLIRLPRSSGTAHYEEILRAMSKIKNTAGISFVSLMEMDIADAMSSAEVFIFTLYTDERILEAAEWLRRLGNRVTIRGLLSAEETR